MPAEPKDFYPIREASRLTQVPAHTLRYWERRLQLVRPTRVDGGQRRYTQGDLDQILKVKELLGRQRLTLEGAKKALAGPRGVRAPSGDAGAAAQTLAKEVRQELDAVLSDMEKFGKEL